MRVEPRLSLSPAPTAVIPPLHEKSKNQAPRNGAQEAGSLDVVQRHQPSCTIPLLNAPLAAASKGPAPPLQLAAEVLVGAYLLVPRPVSLSFTQGVNRRRRMRMRASKLWHCCNTRWRCSSSCAPCWPASERPRSRIG